MTEWCVSEDFAVLADMLQPTLDEIEAVGAQGGVMTGLTDLDRLVPLRVLRSDSCPMATGRNWPAAWGERLAFGDLVRMLFQASGFRL